MAWLVETYAGGSQERFAKDVGTNKESVRKWSLDETRPSMDSLVAILEAYSTVSPEWLMVGKGPRRRDPTATAEQDVALDLLSELRAIYDRLVLRYGEPTATRPPGVSDLTDDDQERIESRKTEPRPRAGGQEG